MAFLRLFKFLLRFGVVNCLPPFCEPHFRLCCLLFFFGKSKEQGTSALFNLTFSLSFFHVSFIIAGREAPYIWLYIRFTSTSNLMKFKSLLSLLLPFFFLSCTLMAQEKQVITQADQLPRYTYELPITDAWALINEDLHLKPLAGAVKADLHKLLREYDIRDNSTLESIHQALLTLALYEADYPTALGEITRIRQLAEKPADKYLSGNLTTAYIQAIEETGAQSGPKMAAVFRERLAASLAAMPYEVIREHVEAAKGSIDMLSTQVVESSIKGQFQPVLDKMGKTVPMQIVTSLIQTRATLSIQLPLKAEIKAVYTALYDANKDDSQPVNIWQDRDFELPASTELATVVIGVWDTGVDMEVLPENNRFINAAETIDGKDNDGNGFVDDRSGIAFDQEIYRNPSILLQEKNLSHDIATLQRWTKGSMDMQAGIDSEEATELKQAIAALTPESYAAFSEDLGFYGVFAHGTHVAGIAAAGNPQAQILAARMEYSTATVPPAPTREKSLRTAQMFRDMVAYFQAHDVRVVNMSWRYGKSAYEGLLAANGIGEDAEERKKIAGELFEIEKTALYEAMAAAPEILFVAGSGNENNDANFEAYIPASLDLPNLITIGAVDSEGKRTSFTTEGASVVAYANGYEVESFVPGGARIKFSGTSMASPQVANLAAKLLSADPTLSVAQLRTLILDGCETSEEGIPLIHPKRSLQMLMEQASAK